ncbi:MAG TPA: TonB-dependent receptor [Chthoniobacterales bacterium]
MKSKPLSSSAIAAVLAAFSFAPALASAQNAAPTPDVHEAGHTLEEMSVTAGPTQRTLFEQAAPVTVLQGDELKQKLATSLGDTLANEPGVSATRFAPGASRPIIRGLDGDRIRVLQNGTNTIDASATSFDHAVSVEPMTVEKIEIVRGPATLLYGPNTVGGVVNVIDNRVPTELPNSALPFTGGFDFRYGTVDDETSRSGLVEFAIGHIVVHLDGSRRETADVDIPGYARSERLRERDPLPAGEEEAKDVLPNSYTNTDNAAGGISYVWDKGYFGVAYSGYDGNYGTVAEPDVHIELEQRRWDVRGEVREPFAGINAIRLKAAYSDYQHTEFEGPEIGTVFKNRGWDGRLEVAHNKLGPIEGTIGYQSQYSDFSALGEEAFLPPVETTGNALFVFEEADLNPWILQAGLRFDWQKVDAAANDNFGPARSRDFDTLGGSAGVVREIGENYAIALSATYTERAPTYQELYADGPHVATDAFEIGDPNLDPEKSFGIDLSFRRKAGFVTGSVSLFYNHFDGFIAQNPTGEVEDDLAVFRYQQTDATLMGGELALEFHLIDQGDQELSSVEQPADGKSGKAIATTDAEAEPHAHHHLHLRLTSDYVYAKDETTDHSLPRMPPFRVGADLVYQGDHFGASLGGQFAAHQGRTAENELPTDSYFLLNASVSYKVDIGPVNVEFYVKGSNLTDEEARLSTSFLKDIAPLPGQSVVFGVSTVF